MSVKVFFARGKLPAKREDISNTVHSVMCECFGSRDDVRRAHRFIGLDAADVLAPSERSLLIEITLGSGWPEMARKTCLGLMATRLTALTSLPASDLDIVILEAAIDRSQGALAFPPPALSGAKRVLEAATAPSLAMANLSSMSSSSSSAMHEDNGIPPGPPSMLGHDDDMSKSRSSSHRHARDFWNQGQYKELRVADVAQMHKPNSSGAGSNVRRCIMCCEACKSTKPHHRKGYKTKFGCFQCSQSAAQASHEDVKDAPILPLCQIPRFKHLNEMRTCFEIHHSGDPYPQLPCTTNDKTRALALPGSAAKRLKQDLGMDDGDGPGSVAAESLVAQAASQSSAPPPPPIAADEQ